jgi:deazaflavin-dependent oxidoreductase (nitroreductase family)
LIGQEIDMESNLDGTPRNQPAARPGEPRVPALVGAFNSIVKRLARLGVPLGPNALLTVRGRKSGQARTTPVAVIAVGGRRWVQSPFGDVNWVRNLRAVGEGTLTTGKREEQIHAVQLSPDEAVTFLAEILGPYLRKSAVSKFMARRLGLGDAIDDPAGAAKSHPVFELKQGAPTA